MDSNVKILYAMVANKSDITIITVKIVDYCCIIHKIITKSEAINLTESA